MRFRPAHAAVHGSSPSPRRMPKPLRSALSGVFAAAIGLVPAIFIATPAQAAANDVTMDVTEQGTVEGNNLQFKVTRENNTSTGLGALTLNVSASGGTATPTDDFTTPPSTLTFSATLPTDPNQDRFITIKTIDDTLDEADSESFTLTVVDPTSVHQTLTGHGAIEDNDDPPTYALSVEDSSVDEDDGPATITAELSAASGLPINIPVKTTNGSAVGPGDFTALVNGAISIPAGQTTGTTWVAITNDNVSEGDEDFTVEVDGNRSATPAGHVGTSTNASVPITIDDDEPIPTISLSGNAALENSPVVFTATLSGPSSQAVTFDVTTTEGTTDPLKPAATSGADYAPLFGLPITISAGSTSVPISVTTIPDSRDELTPEWFRLTAANPNSAVATLATATAVGSIVDVDPPPSVTLSPTVTTEGNSDSLQVFTLTLDSPSNREVNINYATAGEGPGVGHATPGTDFTTATGTVTFPPNATTETFSINIVGDTIDEGLGETFSIALTNSDASVLTGSSLGTNQITIVDDDDVPAFSVDDVTRNEGDPDEEVMSNNAAFTVSLTHASDQPISFVVTSADDSAVDGGTNPGQNDYDAPVGTLIIPALSTTGTINVPVKLDKVFEDDESATVTVDLASGEMDATGATDTSTLTLMNDDDMPTVMLAPQTGGEGTDLTVVATISGVSQTDTVFDMSLTGDSSGGNNPAEPGDFVDSGAQATIPAGTSSNTMQTLRQFRLNNDTIDEPIEAVRVTAYTVGSDDSSYGIYKINDDPGDLPPSVSIGNGSAGEGASLLPLAVSLDFPGDTTETEQTMNIPWSTVDGTAYAPGDYVSSHNTLQINPGLLTGTINVPLVDDDIDEPDQSFSVKLGTVTPAGGTTTDGTAVATIVDNDTAVNPTIVVTPATRMGAGVVMITGTASEGTSVHLWAAPGASGDNFNDVAFLTSSGRGGGYAFSRSLQSGYRFYTRSNDLNSAIKTVRVAELPVLTGGSTSKGKVFLSVASSPRLTGQPAMIQQAGANNTWRTVATGRTNSAGVFSGSWTKLKSGTFITYRAWIGAKPAAGILAGYSANKRVGIR